MAQIEIGWCAISSNLDAGTNAKLETSRQMCNLQQLRRAPKMQLVGMIS